MFSFRERDREKTKEDKIRIIRTQKILTNNKKNEFSLMNALSLNYRSIN